MRRNAANHCQFSKLLERANRQSDYLSASCQKLCNVGAIYAFLRASELLYTLTLHDAFRPCFLQGFSHVVQVGGGITQRPREKVYYKVIICSTINSFKKQMHEPIFIWGIKLILHYQFQNFQNSILSASEILCIHTRC